MGGQYVGIDVGGRRTGVAVGDTETGIASPLEVIEHSDERGAIAALVRIVGVIRPAGVVIGLPINMDGSEGASVRGVRALGERLRAALADAGLGSVEIEYHDERLSSAQADWEMGGSGLTHKQKKARRDAIAAAAVLRDWLGARRSVDGSGGPG